MTKKLKRTIIRWRILRLVVVPTKLSVQDFIFIPRTSGTKNRWRFPSKTRCTKRRGLCRPDTGAYFRYFVYFKGSPVWNIVGRPIRYKRCARYKEFQKITGRVDFRHVRCPGVIVDNYERNPPHDIGGCRFETFFRFTYTAAFRVYTKCVVVLRRRTINVSKMIDQRDFPRGGLKFNVARLEPIVSYIIVRWRV